MTDFRALCAELVDDLELCDWPYKLKETIRADIDRARAALADEPAVPTVMEIVELADKIEAAGLGQVDLVRAALTRWGTSNLAETRSSLGGMPTPVPADKGEVEELVVDELVKRLRTKAATEKANRCHYSAILLTRAADLLEQRHPTPVPVSERLPVGVEQARAALAKADEPAVPDGREPASVTGQPSDNAAQCIYEAENAAQCIYEAMRFERVETTPAWSELGNSLAQDTARKAARTVLARWGNPAPAPPADGEVAELVRLLGSMAAEAELADQVHDASVLDRAADLLQRLSPPLPVPLTYRLPGLEDCDAELMLLLGLLPAHALPLPGQEAEG